MTISKKLFLTLSVALLSLLLVGGYGIWQQGRAQDQHEAMMSSIFPSLNDITSAQHGLANVRVGLRDLLLAEGEDEHSAARAKIAKGKKAFDTAIANYQANNIYNDEDQKKLNDVRDTGARYWDAIQPLISRVNSLDHAHEVALIRQAVPLSHAAEKALDDQYQLNQTLTIKDAADSRAHYESTRNLSVLFIGLVFVLTGCLSLQLFRTINNGLAQIRNALKTVSETLDFTGRTPVTKRDEVGEACEALNQLLEKLQASFLALHSVAQEVDVASQALSDTARQVSAASAAQSESASNMASTVEQMTVSINHVAEQAHETRQGAHEARALVTSGSEIIRSTISDIHEISQVVKHSVAHIQQLESRSAEVGTVVNVIRDIADQTNLLALNAAIEAARAGEQGRGFAVVADEVRKLAERTAKSTQEIAAMIESMLNMAKQTVIQMESADNLVETGVSRADGASRAIEEIGANAEKAAVSITEISAAIQEQGVASNNIAAQVEQTAQMSEESSTAARNTAESAERLDTLVKQQMSTLAQFRV
ncbi:methyl-accepting chemotaxis protein [Microvirgula curvata]